MVPILCNLESERESYVRYEEGTLRRDEGVRRSEGVHHDKGALHRGKREKKQTKMVGSLQ